MSLTITKTDDSCEVQTYKTRFNWAHPFTVTVTPTRLSISENTWDEATEDYIPSKHLYDYTYQKLWIGEDLLHYGSTWEPSWIGNSVLAQIGDNRYLYICDEICEFSMADGDSPVTYNSHINWDDIPYPVLIGKTHTYLMNEYAIIPNMVLEPDEDPYNQYYRGEVGRKNRFRTNLVYKST